MLTPWVPGGPCVMIACYTTRAHAVSPRMPQERGRAAAWPSPSCWSCSARILLPRDSQAFVSAQLPNSSDHAPCAGQPCCPSLALPAWRVTSAAPARQPPILGADGGVGTAWALHIPDGVHGHGTSLVYGDGRCRSPCGLCFAQDGAQDCVREKVELWFPHLAGSSSKGGSQETEAQLGSPTQKTRLRSTRRAFCTQGGWRSSLTVHPDSAHHPLAGGRHDPHVPQCCLPSSVEMHSSPESWVQGPVDVSAEAQLLSTAWLSPVCQ
ncbi:hypothetical protein P7K49_040621 [Saguinus oedipus]|uniref:Uncharacterized protein n=1 Tax=Saguinus oedipus TaxID=9490 RepID=A0ABQ9T9B5_SAGOE|nr:hypothetical protein P7K49_040621 [Saguinus oedipus]